MNKAINRDELLKVLYKGRAAPMYVAGFYPDLPGWDPTWEKRFPEMYGYDVKAAKRLLAEAGYPNGFKAKGWLFPFAGAPLFLCWSRSRPSCARSVSRWSWKRSTWWRRSDPGRDRKAGGYLWAGPPSKKRWSRRLPYSTPARARRTCSRR